MFDWSPVTHKPARIDQRLSRSAATERGKARPSFGSCSYVQLVGCPPIFLLLDITTNTNWAVKVCFLAVILMHSLIGFIASGTGIWQEWRWCWQSEPCPSSSDLLPLDSRFRLNHWWSPKGSSHPLRPPILPLFRSPIKRGHNGTPPTATNASLSFPSKQFHTFAHLARVYVYILQHL